MSSTPAPTPTTPAIPAANPAPANAGLIALFARISRKWERVVLPLNPAALDKTSAAPAFYCVHSLSGAGGTDFQHLAKLMPEVRFYGIQAPPTKMRDPAFTASIEAIAGYYADMLMEFQPKGPFLIGGWSAGAVVGLELAQMLRARGRVVSLLAAIDAAPKNSPSALSRWHPIYLAEVAQNLPAWIKRDMMVMKRSFRSLLWCAVLKAANQARAVIDPKRRENNAHHELEEFMDVSYFPPEEKAFMERLYAAVLSYVPKKYAGQVVAYEALTKPLLDLPQVGRVWRKLASWSTVVPVPGTHLSIIRPGEVEAVAVDLRQRIATVAAQAEEQPATEPQQQPTAATTTHSSRRTA